MTSGSRQSVGPGLGISAALIAAALLVGLAMPSVSAAKLRAPPVYLLPDLERVRTSDAAGVGALARYLPRKLARGVRSAPRDAAAATGAGQRVQLTLLELRNVKRARRVVARWRAGARRARAKPRRAPVGAGGWLASRRGAATVVWRSLSRVGVVHLRARPRPSRAQALAFARFADVELSTPPPRTAWERVLDQIRPNGTVSKRTALQAFSVAYTRLPDVRVRRGRSGEIPDGNLAIGWILRYLSSLTKAQRRVVDRALGLRSSDVRPRGAGDDLGFTVDPELSAAVKQHVETIGANLPPDARLPDHVGIIAGRTELQRLDAPNANADALPINADGKAWTTTTGGAYDHCRVRLLPKGQTQSDERLNHTLAHEAFHCVQFHIIGPAWPSTPDWLKEGTATWGGLKVAPLPFEPKTWLPTYIATPGKGLFQRTYDAVGFYGHIEDTLGEFWPRAAPTLRATPNQAAFEAAGGHEDTAFTTWGSSLFRIGPEIAWQMSSPVTPPDFGQLSPGSLSLIQGSGHLVARALATAQAVVVAAPNRPLLHVRVRGTARMRMTNRLGEGILLQEEDVGSEAEIWLCARGECTCPSGTEGGPPTYKSWGIDSALALTGHPFGSGLGLFGGSGATVTDHSLDEFCVAAPR